MIKSLLLEGEGVENIPHGTGERIKEETIRKVIAGGRGGGEGGRDTKNHARLCD